MSLEKQIAQGISSAFSNLFEAEVATDDISLSPTKKDFEGALTFVTFPYGRITKKRPDETGQLLGDYLKEHVQAVADYNVVKGFLNLVIDDAVWVKTLQDIQSDDAFGQPVSNGQKVMVEYSSPNTNKPLHLGHLRNNFLGHSVSKILEGAGYEVMKTNLVNDRGIHICKSMIAYKQFGNGETPESANIKGDKLVGNYYVQFDQAYKKEVAGLLKELCAKEDSLATIADPVAYKKELEAKGKAGALTDAEKSQMKQLKELVTQAEKEAPLLKGAQEMLRKWEDGDEETVHLWKTMNGWVYDGFDKTYKTMGVEFDKFYYESQTYLLGKDIIDEGLEKGIFFKKEDNSVWIDLTAEKLDEKLVLRGDGTAVYMTQDMGTADLKYKDLPMQKSVYVIGNEQDYHVKVLISIMKKLGRSYADGMYHLSYGMVDLPTGKMKSREGTVVDADDLIQEMVDTAKERTEGLGKIDDFSEEEANQLYHNLALGALKYYLLKVDPKKRMLFNPQESINFEGDTGVYIQYNHAKMNAIIRKAKLDGIDFSPAAYEGLTSLANSESVVITMLKDFPAKVKQAADDYAPSVIANYAYDLAKTYSKFYVDQSIFKEADEKKRALRVALSEQTARVIRLALNLLGIQAPERM
ncbi:MAG: arginine--tRNA ligase [Flammeovirgaceae bacterium]